MKNAPASDILRGRGFVMDIYDIALILTSVSVLLNIITWIIRNY